METGRSIQEFWIDFLLEEEFRSDPAFVAEFCRSCGLQLDGRVVVGVVHSLNDEFGEADLVVLLQNESEKLPLALLIEDKITAGFQPDQAARYRARGHSGVAQSLWQTFNTVLVAPARYIRDGHGFDCAIPLESIGDWVCGNDPTRRAFKIERIARAIAKKNATGVKIVDPVMTSFREWYGERIASFGNGFVAPKPRPAYWDDNWIEWSSGIIPGWQFRHRTRAGILDISHPAFDRNRFDAMAASLSPGSSFCAVGKHRSGIALNFAPISDFAALGEADAIVAEALATASHWQKLICAMPKD